VSCGVLSSSPNVADSCAKGRDARRQQAALTGEMLVQRRTAHLRPCRNVGDTEFLEATLLEVLAMASGY